MGEVKFDTIIDSINLSQRLIDNMLEYEDSEGYCIITQKELANRLGKSQGLVSKLLRRLYRVDNCIEIFSRGKYKVYNKNLSEKGPYVKVFKLLSIFSDNPRLIKQPLKQLSDTVGMTIKDIEMAYGFINGFRDNE